MYVRFTPKQISKAKDFLKTASLKAYDIQIFSEIVRALENPMDEKTHELVRRGSSERFTKPVKKEIGSSRQEPIIKEAKPEPPKDRVLKENEQPIKGNIIEEPISKVETQPEELVKHINVDENTTDTENAGIFAVIDNRTKKSKGDYI